MHLEDIHMIPSAVLRKIPTILNNNVSIAFVFHIANTTLNYIPLTW